MTVASDAAMTKRCYDCGLVKPIDEFAFHNKAKGTRQARCRQCHATYRREHYVRNRETYIGQEVARIRRYREENRPLIREYLRTHPCVDCGETDIVVLDFDHRDASSKEHNVMVLALHKGWSRVLAEIAKCDVRCANCHRQRTAVQFGWAKTARDNRRNGKRSKGGHEIGLFEFAASLEPDLKRCGTCRVEKPLSMFPFKDRALGKRGSKCLACTAAYSREHYRRNRPVYLEKANRSRKVTIEQNKQFVREYLLTHPCVDCGEANPLLLDFDHRDRLGKVAAVARLVRDGPLRVVLAEIEKCDVRCANCHRRRTAAQFGWSKLETVAS